MRKILNTLKKVQASYPDNTFILSVSGGVDSMVLLDSAIKTKLNCVVVNFNHHKRKTSEKEAKLVEKVAIANNLKVVLKDIKIEKNSNFQKLARDCRIALLKEIAKENNTDLIVTAHHSNDLAETMLMNFVSQGMFKSLSGFDTKHEDDGFIFLKPFKEIKKSKLYEYAKKYNLNFFEDESNFKNNYTRNQFRNLVIPELEKQNPKLTDRLFLLSEIFQSLDESLKKTAFDFIQNKKIFYIHEYLKHPLHIRLYILAELLNQNKIAFNLKKITQIDKLISSTRPNGLIKLTDTWFFKKTYAHFSLENQANSPLLYKYNIDNFCFNSKHPQTSLINCIIEYSTDALKLPFLVRTQKPGDLLNYSYGKKSVAKLFKDAKVPLYFRKQYPILTDSAGQIIYIPKLYKNDTLGVGETLKIEFTGELCEIYSKKIFKKS